jgi:hypothetical protein
VVQRGRMFQIVHQMRTRIMTNSAFTAERILAAILFENTADHDVEGHPTASQHKLDCYPYLLSGSRGSTVSGRQW